MNFAAFDLGASGGKLFLAGFERGRLSFEEVHRFENRAHWLGDGLYWDFVHIHAQLMEGLRKAVRSTGDDIRSLGIDSYSNDFGVVDANGELVFPVRCYRDPRTGRHADAIDAIMPPGERYRLSGNQNALFNTLMQLAAMRLAGQGRVMEDGNRMLLIPDLIAFMLTGRAASEYTVASVTQMYDFRAGGWCKQILDAYGIPESFLAPVIPPGTPIGTTRDSVNRRLDSRGFGVVSVCEHDTASAFLASSAAPGKAAIMSSGTWVMVGVELPGPLYSDEGCRLNFANEGGYPGRHRYLRNSMGTWILQELRREFAAEGREYDFARLDALAERCAPFRFLFNIDDPRFFSPGDMKDKIAACCRQQYGEAPQSDGEYVRAVQESLAMRYRWIVDKLEELTGLALSEVNIVGGGSRGELACRFTASSCGRRVLAGPGEATALGNVAVQMVAAGAVKDIAEAKEAIRSAFPPKEYLPSPGEGWEEAYQTWRIRFAR